MVNLECLSYRGTVMDKKPVSSIEHLCKLCSQIVRTMVPVVANSLVALDPVFQLKDRKVEFSIYFYSYGEPFQNHDAGATMGTHYRCIRDPKRGGTFRGKV